MKPATHKLVLLSMADRADEYHRCYPSIKRLTVDTGLDRKTIICAMAKMVEAGLIMDTGERCGVTNQVKIYCLGVTLKSTESGTVTETKTNGEKEYQKRNSTENGTVPIFPVKSPENGTCNSTENGTRNQSLNQSLNQSNADTLNSENQKAKSKGKKPQPETLITVYIETRKANSEKAIPENDAVFRYADKVGLPLEFLALGWKVFRDDMIRKAKKQKDWPQTFRTYVENDFLKIWAISSTGEYYLNTKGKQAQLKYQAEA